MVTLTSSIGSGFKSGFLYPFEPNDLIFVYPSLSNYGNTLTVFFQRVCDEVILFIYLLSELDVNLLATKFTVDVELFLTAKRHKFRYYIYMNIYIYES